MPARGTERVFLDRPQIVSLVSRAAAIIVTSLTEQTLPLGYLIGGFKYELAMRHPDRHDGIFLSLYAESHRCTRSIDMASEKTYLEAIGRIEADVNGVIATAAVDMDSGMTLASKSNRADFDLTVASAYNSELVKQKLKIMQALHLKSTLEDMLLTLSDQIHLIKIFPGSKTFLYLAADKGSTNLAILRSAVARHCAGID
jgi:hypothetical protein